MPRHNAITDVPGIEVGHATDLDALTGCTVIPLPPVSAAASYGHGKAIGRLGVRASTKSRPAAARRRTSL